MTEVLENREVIINVGQYDPTGTTKLRNIFARDMKQRFQELIKVIRESVIKQDCFGLEDKSISVHQITPLGRRTFMFMRNPEKVEAFMRWLKQQEDRGLLTTGQFTQIGRAINEAWTNMYIFDSYKRGVIRARYELQKAGIPPLDETGGIDVSMSTPFHMDRVGLLFTRVFAELTGITAQMDTIISQILSQSMIDGDGIRLIARKLVAAIDGTGLGTLGITDKLGRFIPAERRAMMLARTETIRAFNEAQLQEFRNWGVSGVNAKAEWLTSGDDKVCLPCHKMEGKVFTLEEASGKIPFHPLCRCCWLPVVEGLEKYYKK